MDRGLPDDWCSGSLTFVPASPPRLGRFARWRPEAAVGLFADDLVGADAIEVMVPRGNAPRPETMPVDLLPVAQVLDAWAGRDVTTGNASPSARWWAAATTLALELIARGRIVPAVMADGWDAWHVDPLDPTDLARLDGLVAACPPDAHATLGPRRGTVTDPAWLVRAYLDAVADAIVRTAAAPVAAGATVFAEVEPHLAEPFRSWAGAAYGHLTSSTRLGLRVEVVDDRSDDETRGHFEVVAQVRSSRDPSLIVDVDALADASVAVRSRLGPTVDTDVMLGMARAARHWPPLDVLVDGLVGGRDASEPAGAAAVAGARGRLAIEPDDLADLLDASFALGASGVDVLLPSTFTAALRPRLVAGVPAPSAVSTEPTVGLGTLLDFRWELLCDGVPLTDAEVDAVADAKRGLVWLRGQWVRVDPALIERLRRPPVDLDGPAGLAAALSGETVDVDGQVIEVVTTGLADLVRERLGELAGWREEPEPPGLAAELRPYQRRGVAWMADLCAAGLGGVLADDMGLGKTVQVIALHLVRTGARSGSAVPSPMLVVCPTSLAGNWQRELARFAPGVPVRRLGRGERDLSDLAPDEVVIVTYGLMRRMVDDLAEVEWGVVVADEAQHVKNPRSRTARALRLIDATARIALTGTPVENRLSELWALLDWTTPGLLGSFERFREQFAVPIERNGSQVAVQRLGVLTRPFMLRRRKTDDAVAVDLPSRTQHDVVVPLSSEQLTMYEALVRESLFRINGSEGATRVGMVFRLLTGLKQIANHPAQYLHEADGPLGSRSGKLDAAVDLVGAAVDGDERVLVFSQYVEMCDLLHRRFAEDGIASEVLHGGLSGPARDRLVERFQAGEIPVLVISLKAGGTGLNLTAATQVVHFDRWWNPAVEDQATDRAWRIGQTKPVVVHRLIAEGTIDERIAEMIERKRSLADTVVGGGGETWIADLSDADLADLVKLRTGAATFRSGVLL